MLNSEDEYSLQHWDTINLHQKCRFFNKYLKKICVYQIFCVILRRKTKVLLYLAHAEGISRFYAYN